MTIQYDNGKVVVVDQLHEQEVQVFDIGADDEEIAMFGYYDKAMSQAMVRRMAEEYANGYLHGKES